MTKKSITAYRNPLNRFLDSDEDCASGLEFIARHFAEPFDPVSFQTRLIAKLKSHRYRPAVLKGNEKTFHEILTNAGVLDVLLQNESLYELWQCILLKKIVQHSRDLEKEHKAVDGQPLRDLMKKERQLSKDLTAIDEIARRYDFVKEAEELCKKLDRKYRDILILQLISTKYKGSRAELLSGGMEDKPSKNPRDEDVAAKRAIFRTLQNRLKTRKKGSKKLYTILLCQLAELIWAAPDSNALSNGINLYTHLKRVP